jgi:tRNA/rRNA methyltransferase
MGIGRLLVVDPEDYDQEKVNRMATHAAKSVVDGLRIFNSLSEALSPFTFVVGTTARLGGERGVAYSPRTMAQKLVEISVNNDIALVFGAEDRGLVNEDIRLCHELINIPTAAFSSLNLAQAVMVVCYEIFSAAKKPGDEFVPRLANRFELDGMYADVKDLLVKIDYIKPDNPEYWMGNVRRFFTRMGLRAKEVTIIRGLCRQINWYAKQQFAQGKKSRDSEKESQE